MEASNFFGMYSLLRDFHVMPSPGGLLDQDSYFIFLVHWAQQMESIRIELENHDAEVRQGGR